jgi:hypothetical protein
VKENFDLIKMHGTTIKRKRSYVLNEHCLDEYTVESYRKQFHLHCGNMKEKYTASYRVLSLSVPHQWSLQRLLCMAADNASIVAIPFCRESGYTFYFNVLQFILHSYSLYLK